MSLVYHSGKYVMKHFYDTQYEWQYLGFLLRFPHGTAVKNRKKTFDLSSMIVIFNVYKKLLNM